MSVVITAYNEETLVERAIRSILSQTYEDWELILVDDGSEDDTFSVMQKMALLDRRIRCVQLEHVGRREALNRAILESRGKYIALCDADDYSLPRRLELQVAFLESNPDVGVLGTAYIRNDVLRGEKYVRRYPVDDASIRRAMATHIPICQGSVMIRREVYDKVGLYKTEDLEDFELYLRAAPHFRFANLSTPLYVYELLPNHGVYHRKPHQWRRGLRLTALCLRAIRVLGLPRWWYFKALIRPLYSLMPSRLKTLVRRRAGYIWEDTLSE